MQKITTAAKQVNTIACSFVQEKKLSMLTDKAISKGKFYFKKEDKVRLEYQTPVKNLIVMNNGKVLIKDDKKTTQTDVYKNKALHQLNKIIVGSINGGLFSNADFSYQLFESSTQIKIELTPLQKTLKGFLATVVLVLEKKDFTAATIIMIETSGDTTTLDFSGKEVNGIVSDTLFAVY